MPTAGRGSGPASRSPGRFRRRAFNNRRGRCISPLRLARLLRRGDRPRSTASMNGRERLLPAADWGLHQISDQRLRRHQTSAALVSRTHLRALVSSTSGHRRATSCHCRPIPAAPHAATTPTRRCSSGDILEPKVAAVPVPLSGALPARPRPTAAHFSLAPVLRADAPTRALLDPKRALAILDVFPSFL